MESDESIDLADSEAVNAYGSVVAKEDHENPCEYIPRKVKMLIHHVFIHSAIFFHWSLPTFLNRTKGQLKFPARGEEHSVRKSDRGCCPCKAANKNCKANCQSRDGYRVQSHPSAWHLETFQWHGQTRSSNNFILLFEIYQFSLENILPSFIILKRF